MIVIPEGAKRPIRSDLLVRVVLRSDLTPIPLTVELEVRDVAETKPLREGAICKVGRDQHEFLLVRRGGHTDDGYDQTMRNTGTRAYIGLLASCAPIADPLQRAVIRYGATLGDVYRACGARVRIESDFTLPIFVCMKGLTPSFELAKSLVEAAGSIVVTDAGQIAFRRLPEMLAQSPIVEMREDSAEQISSNLLERQLVPSVFSTDRSGEFLQGRTDSSRGIAYRPRASMDILNNMRSVPITRRRVMSGFAPHINAGHCIKLAGARYFVLTAAHAFETGGDGADSVQASTLWLAQVAA